MVAKTRAWMVWSVSSSASCSRMASLEIAMRTEPREISRLARSGQADGENHARRHGTCHTTYRPASSSRSAMRRRSAIASDRFVLREAPQDGHIGAQRVAFRTGREHGARERFDAGHRIRKQNGADVGGDGSSSATRSCADSMAKVSMMTSAIPATTSCCFSSSAPYFSNASAISSRRDFLRVRNQMPRDCRATDRRAFLPSDPLPPSPDRDGPAARA